MTLQLRYNSHIHLPVAAAFIRGADAAAWLREISSWQLAPADFTCYVMPVSSQSIQAAGLFAVFKKNVKINRLNLLEPFACVAGRLFIPVNAQLSPAAGETELQQLLLWHVQVLHPALGFVGFEEKDQLKLPDLFLYGEPLATDWSFAHPGLPERPGFQYIQVEAPSAEEMLSSIKEEIGQKPLAEIPEDPAGKQTAIDRLLTNIKFGILGGLLSFSEGINQRLPATPQNDAAGGPGIFQKFQHWLQTNLEALEQRRNNELQRLMKLFDEDSEEALRYAIPLNSPYLDRGTAAPSDTLQRRAPNFDLRRLGGGRGVDGWDIGNYYQTLRGKYLASAQRETQLKEFKKAAYVYAHLLGDFNAAANVLQQGGFYREAAALYKDHLKNIPAAAECLEKGELYNEAIALYRELQKNEKVADLYRLLQQEKEASLFYEKYIKEKQDSGNYLDAARVVKEKLQAPERAKSVLLEGWQGTYQSESCLKGYFDIVLQEDAGAAAQAVNTVYHNHTPRHKKMPFLNVLDYVGKKRKEEDFAARSREIMFEIVHAEAEEGNLAALHNLQLFLPADRMVAADASRYISQMQGNKPATPTPGVFYLNKDIKWLKACWHRNQFLVIGLKDGYLQMARVNWYANTEYYSWSNRIESTDGFYFVNAPLHSNQVLLLTSGKLALTRKNLPRNKYFNEPLLLASPIWMHKTGAGYAINEEKDICGLVKIGRDAAIQYYSAEGELKRTVTVDNSGSLTQHGFQAILYQNGYFYTYYEKEIICISTRGIMYRSMLDSIIRVIAIAPTPGQPYLLVSTNRGCSVFVVAEGKIKLQGDVFAQDMIPSRMVFVSAAQFVITEQTRAVLFEIKPGGGTPVQVKRYQLHQEIIAVLPGAGRHQFAMIEQGGRIELYGTEK